MTTPFGQGPAGNNSDNSAGSSSFSSMPSYDASADPSTAPDPVRPSFWLRFGGYVIDAIVVLLISLVPSIPIVMSQMTGGAELDGVFNLGSTILFTVIGLVVWFVYRCLMEASSKGGTLGKMITGTRVVNYEGGPISLQQAAIRNSFYAIQSVAGLVPFVGWALSLAVYVAVAVTINKSSYNQSFCDEWAGAYVIYRERN